MGRVFLNFLLAAVLLGGAGARASNSLNIGYLELEGDARYGERRLFARFLNQPLGRPYDGAVVALGEAKFVGAALGIEFGLHKVEARDAAEMIEAIEKLNADDVHFFIIDAPAEIVAEVAAATRGKQLLLFNITAREDALRQKQCQPHLLHIIPNYAMLTDALSQYLVFRKWRRVLALEGPLEDDRRLAAAFERSAKRYGLKVVARRPFVLSNDPRQRDQNNIALLTGGKDYDVVFVADTDGEFARSVPYSTIDPRPIVGSEGLAAAAWHWAWERHGAPQLEKRFEKQAKRPMTSIDWAAWMAVKAVAEGVTRAPDIDYDSVREFLLGDTIILDGFKGNRLNFRPWDHQLRQPVLLITHNWVIERAPLPGFLHPKYNLDTLGFDERESQCRF